MHPKPGSIGAFQCQQGGYSARQRISAPDVDGWREVLSQGSLSGAEGARPARTASTNQRPPTRYPEDLRGKCFNCLSTAHRVATCKLPLRCLHAASDARGSDTSRGTVSSDGRCLLPTPAQLVPKKAGNNALSESISWATDRIVRTTRRAWLGLCRVQ